MGGQVLAISAFRAMNSRWLSGTSSSMKIASTGHSGTHRPQSMQASGSMYTICSPSRKASTGQTTTQSVYLQPKQGLVTTWAMGTLLQSGGQPPLPVHADSLSKPAKPGHDFRGFSQLVMRHRLASMSDSADLLAL